MEKIEVSVVIDRPAEEVWAYAMDFEKRPLWRSGLLEDKVTSEGPIGVGTTHHAVGQMIGRRMEFDAVITEYEPPHKCCDQSTAGPFPAETCLALQPVEGGTRVTQVVEADVGGFFRLAEPLVVRLVRRNLESELHNLKDILEVQQG